MKKALRTVLIIICAALLCSGCKTDEVFSDPSVRSYTTKELLKSFTVYTPSRNPEADPHSGRFISEYGNIEHYMQKKETEPDFFVAKISLAGNYLITPTDSVFVDAMNIRFNVLDVFYKGNDVEIEIGDIVGFVTYIGRMELSYYVDDYSVEFGLSDNLIYPLPKKEYIMYGWQYPDNTVPADAYRELPNVDHWIDAVLVHCFFELDTPPKKLNQFRVKYGLKELPEAYYEDGSYIAEKYAKGKVNFITE